MVKSVSIPSHFPQIYQQLVPLNVPGQGGNFLTVMPCVCVLTLQTGLIVACYQGYVDVVVALSQCPHLDVNWQDNEGNTALTTAAQAGKSDQTASIQITTCTHLHLDYRKV